METHLSLIEVLLHGFDRADNKSRARWCTFDIRIGRPRWSILRIHLERVSPRFDNFRPFAGISLREVVPFRRVIKVLLGTSKAVA